MNKRIKCEVCGHRTATGNDKDGFFCSRPECDASADAVVHRAYCYNKVEGSGDLSEAMERVRKAVADDIEIDFDALLDHGTLRLYRDWTTAYGRKDHRHLRGAELAQAKRDLARAAMNEGGGW